MPGVADQIRKTQLKQDQKSRKSDMEELLKLVSEGRLHEADERQLESLKMVLELNSLLDSRESLQPTIAPEQLVEAVKQAISEGMSNVTINALGGGGHAADPARPQMKHTSLTDLAQSKETVNISHKGGVSKEIEGEESTDKLEKLRKIKGGK